MSELQNIIKSKYDNDWIALSNSDKIFQLTNLVSSQKNHYGFKPQGLWLGLGDNWLQYIKDNDMTDWISEYCSAFSIELGSNILILKDKEDYVNFTKRYSKNSSNIKWEVVARKYDGIVAYQPRRFALDRSLSWTYGWDITSACIWNSEGIKDIDEILNGCNDESFESFKRGGIINNPNFKEWFGDSKVVDEKGNPLVVYHGTDKEFNIFDESYTAFNTDNQGFLGRGFYFTTRKEDASQYGNIIKPFYLKADKVLDLRSISYEELSQLLPNLIMKDGISWSEGFRRKKEIADSIENVSYRESGRNGFYYVDYEIDGEDYDVPNRTIGEIEKDNGLSVAVFNAMSKNGYLDPNNIGAIGNYFNPQLIREEMIRMGYNAVISNGTNITDIGDEIMVFSPNQIKSAIGNSGEYDPNNPSIIMAEGGQVCTYDFDGYDLAKKKCGNEVDVYLIPAEYKLVSIHLFDNHFPLWLYYNYLARIVISKEDVFTFKKQCLEKFEITNPVRVLVKPYNDKFWKKTPIGEPRSYMGYSTIKGIIQKLEINLVQNGSWANKFKERTSGLTIPNPKGVHLNTVIHEFAHLIDVLRYNKKNPNEDVIVTHERGFLVALVDVLIACKRNEIPIVNMVDNKALIIQKALQKPSFVERYKDTYGLNVFDGSVPKDLKEYDERFASLKGSKLNKEQAKEMFNLIKKYQDEVLMGMAMINPNKANRLFKSTNDLLTELKKYS